MNSVTIAPASESDREWCAQLMAGTDPWITLGRGLEECRTVCCHAEYLLFVARAGPERCGFVLLHPRGLASSPYIASIATAGEFRGKGIGSRLLAFAESFVQPRARHIFLCVSSFNTRARALYERQGYTVVGELKDYALQGASELIMDKVLEKS
ncbi:MAG: GNAT family N-acetyltransferase [Acidobacteriia bacterium]|nr:GNAT family N-acetyltransferase [Terriglobia bacterium]